MPDRRFIDVEALKLYYSWWGDNSKEKQLFDQIISVQPNYTEAEIASNWFQTQMRELTQPIEIQASIRA